MDDLKLCAENKDHLQYPLDIMKRLSGSIRVDFGLGKFRAVSVDKRMVVRADDSLRLDDIQSIELLDRSCAYKYLGMVQTSVIKHRHQIVIKYWIWQQNKIYS